MNNQKQVNIVGISIVEDFGILKAVQLEFDKQNRLTVVKGEVGSGKTTLQTAIRLNTAGSATLQDKQLYGDNINIVTQLADGENKVFIGCRTNKDDSLGYFIYMIDENGNKINDPVLDGVKATPASYLKSLQTALTWRLDELTSQNPITVRNILLELYSKELEEQGVVFDKNNPAYVDGIIDKIEKAKANRNLMDMRRKEVGGIADDMTKKGIDYECRKEIVNTDELTGKISKLKAEIEIDKSKPEETKTTQLNDLLIAANGYKDKLRLKNDEFTKDNLEIQKLWGVYDAEVLRIQTLIKEIKDRLKILFPNPEGTEWEENFETIELMKPIEQKLPEIVKPEKELLKLVQFNDKGTCISKPEEFENNKEVFELLTNYRKAGIDYAALNAKPTAEVDTAKKQGILEGFETKLKNIQNQNKDAAAINAFHNWQESNTVVKDLNKDYYKKLTKIQTGVEGLCICPEYDIDEDGNRIAKGNDIYLMYDGSYDVEYFNNKKKELRKLSAYSDTQKPMICLLIQKYLLSKKPKVLPYLWIDQVPIDKKTKELLDRMSEELGLWLFVNWTGDFSKTELKNGEILVENGEVFLPLKTE